MIKLSEALLLGSVLPDYNWNDSTRCTCGQTLRAIGKMNDNAFVPQWPKLHSQWTWTTKNLTCPECDLETNAVVMMSHLSAPFTHNWPMSRIADWIETIEPASLASPQSAECKAEEVGVIT